MRGSDQLVLALSPIDTHPWLDGGFANFVLDDELLHLSLEVQVGFAFVPAWPCLTVRQISILA